MKSCIKKKNKLQAHEINLIVTEMTSLFPKVNPPDVPIYLKHYKTNVFTRS